MKVSLLEGLLLEFPELSGGHNWPVTSGSSVWKPVSPLLESLCQASLRRLHHCYHLRVGGSNCLLPPLWLVVVPGRSWPSLVPANHSAVPLEAAGMASFWVWPYCSQHLTVLLRAGLVSRLAGRPGLSLAISAEVSASVTSVTSGSSTWRLERLPVTRARCCFKGAHFFC